MCVSKAQLDLLERLAKQYELLGDSLRVLRGSMQLSALTARSEKVGESNDETTQIVPPDPADEPVRNATNLALPARFHGGPGVRDVPSATPVRNRAR